MKNGIFIKTISTNNTTNFDINNRTILESYAMKNYFCATNQLQVC